MLFNDLHKARVGLQTKCLIATRDITHHSYAIITAINQLNHAYNYGAKNVYNAIWWLNCWGIISTYGAVKNVGQHHKNYATITVWCFLCPLQQQLDTTDQ